MQPPAFLLLTLPLIVLASCGAEPGTEATLPSSRFEDLRGEDTQRRVAAVHDLVTWWEEGERDTLEAQGALDELLPVLGDLARIAQHEDDEYARWNAVYLLGEMGLRAHSTVDALVHATHEEDIEARQQALESLAKVASPRLGVIEGIRRSIRDALPPATRAALERWDPPDPEKAFGPAYVKARDKALAAVFRTLQEDDSVLVRRTAIHRLGSWGPRAVHLAADVVPYLRHEDRDLRQSATYTLRALEPPARVVLEPYMDFIRSTRRDMRGRVMIASAVLGLGELGGDAYEALGFLRRLARDPQLAKQAQKAIAKIEAGLSVVEGRPR